MIASVSNARKLATWHTIALSSDALTVTIMDTLQQIALTKYHLQPHQQDAGTTPLVGKTDQHLRIIPTPGITTMTIGIGTDSVDPDPTHITLDIGAIVAMIPAEGALDPFTNPCIIAHHAREAQAHTATTKTHHTTDPRHAEISPEMTVDLGHVTPTNTLTKPHKDHLPVHNQHPGSPRIGSKNRLQLMTHHQNITALMNQDSNSEDDLN